MRQVNMWRGGIWSLAALTVMLLAGSARGDLWTAGHGDLGFAYEDGAWHPHVHIHDGATIDGGEIVADAEYAPGGITIVVPNTVYGPGGTSANYWDVPESLGLTQGDRFWNLSSSPQDGAPFVGLGAGEVESGLFLNNKIKIQLTAFKGPSGGDFSLWHGDLDAGGVFMQTYGGLSDADALLNFPVGAGSHTHWNWAFSEPGEYFLTLTAIGEFADGSGMSLGSGTYHILVNNHVPEPSTLMLASLGLGGLVSVTYWRRRRASQR